MVYGREDTADDNPVPLRLMRHSATEPKAAALIRTSLERHILRPLAECLDGPDAEARAAMVVAQITRFSIRNKGRQVRVFAEVSKKSGWPS